MNDYFSKNKIEGVTVSLYSIMFSPSELESTHEVIFSGEAEAMAKLYSPEFQNMSWQLFATKINNFIEPVFSGNERASPVIYLYFITVSSNITNS